MNVLGTCSSCGLKLQLQYGRTDVIPMHLVGDGSYSAQGVVFLRAGEASPCPGSGKLSVEESDLVKAELLNGSSEGYRTKWQGTCPSCKRTVPVVKNPLITNGRDTLVIGVHWLDDDGVAGPRCPGSHMLATEALSAVREDLIHVLELTR